CDDAPQPAAADIAAAEQLTGVAMTAAERDLMLEDIRWQREAYDVLHAHDLPNELPPALVFDPGFEPLPPAKPEWTRADIARPENDIDLVFLSVAELGALLRNGSFTSEELTGIYLNRIHERDDEIKAVITLTEALALEQARRADAELAQGNDR